MESAAELIVNPPMRHLRQGRQRHVQIGLMTRRPPVTEEYRQEHGVGEFGLRTEAAVGLIEGVIQFARGILDDGPIEGDCGLAEVRKAVEPLQNPLRRLADLGLMFAIVACNSLEHLWESGPSEAIVRREIGSAVERLP